MGHPEIDRLDHHTHGWVNVKTYGMGDGSTDDAARLAAAQTKAAAEGLGIVITTKVRIASAAGTISAPIRFEGGGSLDLQTGGSVTLSGELLAGYHQIFYINGGTLTFSAKVPWLLPQWWGAAGDGSDDTTALTRTVAAAYATSGACIYLRNGTYTTDGVTLSKAGRSGITIVGESTTGTILKGSASATFVLGVVGTYNQYNTFRNFTIDMSSMSDLSTRNGIYLAGTYGNSFKDITVIQYDLQQSLLVEDGTYTSRFDNCDFGSTTGPIVVSGTSDYPTTLTFSGCSFGTATIDKANFLTFDRCIVQGALNKFTPSNIIGLYITYCDVEGTGTFLALGSAVTELYSVGNGLAGFSGTYSSGSFTGGILADVTSGFRLGGAGLSPGTAAGATQAGRLFQGSGAPSNSDGSDGDVYFRTDGTAAGGTCMYHKESGSWVAVV